MNADVVSLKEAAEILNVSVTRVRQLCMLGQIESTKVANNLLVDKQSVLDRKEKSPKAGRPKNKD